MVLRYCSTRNKVVSKVTRWARTETLKTLLNVNGKEREATTCPNFHYEEIKGAISTCKLVNGLCSTNADSWEYCYNHEGGLLMGVEMEV
jgi:hypothetical protein